MSEQPKVEIAFAAKFEDLQRQLGELDKKFSRFATDTKSSLGGLDSVLSGIEGRVKSLVAAWLSYEGIKRAIQQTAEMGREQERLAEKLGTSRAEAAAISVAMGDVGGTTSQYESAVTRLNRQLMGNSENLTRYGFSLDEVKRKNMSQSETLLYAIQIINGYTAGINRNQAAMAILGARGGDVTALLRLNNEVMEEARGKVEKLNLALDPALMKEYRKEMSDLGDVGNGFVKGAGEQLILIVNRIANTFTKLGTETLPGLRKFFSYLAAMVQSIIGLFDTFIETLITVGRLIGNFLGATAKVATALIQDKSLSKAWEEAKTGADLIVRDMDDHAQRIAKSIVETESKIQAALNFGAGAPAPGTRNPPPGGGRKAPGPAQPRSVMQEIEAELAQKKAAYEYDSAMRGDYQRFTLSMESEFWAKYLKLSDFSLAEQESIRKRYADAGTQASKLNVQEQLAVKMKYWALETALAREKFANDMADLRAEQAQYRVDLESRLAIAQEIQRRYESAGGMHREATQAKRETESILREMRDRNRQMEDARIQSEQTIADRLIDIKLSQNELEVQLLQRSRLQSIEFQEDAENEKFRNLRSSLYMRQSLLKADREEDKAAIEAFNQQIQQLEVDHQAKVLEIKKQATLESRKYQIEAQIAIQDSFATMISSMAMDIRNLNKAFTSFINSILKSLNDLAAKRIGESLFGGGTTGGNFLQSLTNFIFPAAAATGGSMLGSGLAMPASTSGGFGYLSSITSGLGFHGYAEGTDYVPKTGLYQLHEGEKVTPANENTGETATNGGMRVYNTFNVSGAIDSRTQQQLAVAAGRGLQRAMRRGT